MNRCGNLAHAQVLLGLRFNKRGGGSPFKDVVLEWKEGSTVTDSNGLFLVPFSQFQVGDIDFWKNFLNSEYVTYLVEYLEADINPYPYGYGMPDYIRLLKEVCVYKCNIISLVNVENVAEKAMRFCQDKQRKCTGTEYVFPCDSTTVGDAWDNAFYRVRKICEWHNSLIDHHRATVSR